MRDLVRLAIFVLIVSATMQAQGPRFEVASIKLDKSGAGATSLGFQQGGRFRAVNEPLWRLIAEAYRTAYQLRRFEILGLPDSLASDRYDVEAVPAGNSTPAERQVMLQQLLKERFKLVAHEETRELAIYRLVTARSDRRLGPAIRRSDVDCAALRADGRTPPAPTPDQPRPCVMMFGQSLLSTTGMTMTDLGEMGLSRYTNRPVVDQTGLKGPFAWKLEWTPDTPAGAQPNLDGVSIFTALQEQLGLKLESSRGPVRVLVIDQVDRPTED
jgi:uncharacterized protein (TIGR03435 family)